MTKICAVCKRTMSDNECGNEFPDERVCDKCAGISETFVEFDDRSVWHPVTQPTPSIDVETFTPIVEKHLTRYIENRNKRTHQTWRVVRRFQTGETDWKRMYDRAYIDNVNSHIAPATRVRIFYDIYARCWKRS